MEERFLNLDTGEWCKDEEELREQVGEEGFIRFKNSPAFEQRIVAGSVINFSEAEMISRCRIKTFGSMEEFYKYTRNAMRPEKKHEYH